MLDFNLERFNLINKSVFEDTILKERIQSEADRTFLKRCYTLKPFKLWERIDYTPTASCYSLRGDLKDKERSKAIDLLIKYSTEHHYLKNRLTRSAFYNWKITGLEFGGLNTYTEAKHQGNQKAIVAIADSVLDYTQLPAKLDQAGSGKLLIPGKIAANFGYTREFPRYWLMGTYGIDTDTLFFFPSNHHLNEYQEITIRTITPELMPHPDDLRASVHDIFIWHEPLLVLQDRSQLYLKVPKMFLEEQIADTILIKGKGKFSKPAFNLSYDPCGNLVFERVCYAERSKHIDQFVRSSIYASEIPSSLEVDEIESFSYEGTLQEEYRQDYIDTLNDEDE